MIALIAYLLVAGTLLAAAAHGAEDVLRLVRRPTRWAWVAAMLVLAAFTLRAPLSPTASLPVAPLTVSNATIGSSGGPASDGALVTIATALADIRGAVAATPGVIVAAIERRLPASAAFTAGVAWAAMSAALVALLAIAYLRFRRDVNRLPVSVLQGKQVRVSPYAGPAVVGLAPAAIVVPQWLLGASAQEQHAAMAHEAEHIAARDPLLLLGGCAIVALLPWHPAAWWMLSRLRLAVEVDCDTRVLARGMAPGAYGSALIEIAARCARLPIGVPALVDGTTHLERRLIAMTPATNSFRRTRTFGMGAAALLTVLAACEARLPSPTEIEAMDVSALQKHPATRLPFLADGAAEYYIDDAKVTAQDAAALPASGIAAIVADRQRSTIRITTHSASGGEAGATAAPGAMVPYISGAVGAVVQSSRLERSFTGLILIDGTRSDAVTMSKLNPGEIASISVLKGSAATSIYTEPEAANGVILVTTKPAK